ncbi:uncharacterized protein SPSK_01910 [Sporothrix schenckii 1099-18]|uniref:Uncharacterized protein n=1 Tax=Sporothrix schenckii 1099-18 TaxID=1397361 RepID=A0A0F2MCP0_SPOSC|nr:uncharacterized protein SPSK_01910 [Sporothrix schenckii 1099-18]KJR87438.1 hypothetical protein SPSK_01910 [Sporothrix schenckii 1099-18]
MVLTGDGHSSTPAPFQLNYFTNSHTWDAHQVVPPVGQPATTTTTTTTTAEDLRLQDLKTYKHCHEIFVACSAVPSKTGEANRLTTTVTLHSRGPASKIARPSGSPLTSYSTSPSPSLSPSLSLSQPLVTLTVPLSVAAFGTALTEVGGFTDLGAVGLPGGGDGGVVQLYTVPMYGEYAALGHIFSDGRVPVWKWVKPAGPYGHYGTLEDGQWRGGTDLMLLVAGVSEATRQSLVGRRSSSLRVLTC